MEKVQIICNPTKVLVDEQFIIRVEGWHPRDQLTIQSIVREDSMTFSACGCYQADDSGNVDVTQHPSLNGTYTGKKCFR